MGQVFPLRPPLDTILQPQSDRRWPKHQHAALSPMTRVELRNRSGEMLVSDLRDTGE